MSARERLFRGKRVDTGEWVQGAFIPDALETTLGTFGLDGYIKPAGRTKEERLMVEVDRDTVGQYTGLTDKNGKRIFEGDIVEIDNDIFVVRWIDGFASFDLRHSTNMRKAPPITSNSVKRMKVIGNIHDNPELLKRAFVPESEELTE